MSSLPDSVPSFWVSSYRVPSDRDYKNFLEDPNNIEFDEDPKKNGTKRFYRALRFHDEEVLLANPTVQPK